MNAHLYEKNKILYVKPQEGCYDMIYRSACGVYWDDNEQALYLKDNPLEKESVVNQIKFALKNEYGIDLTII